MSRGLSTGEGLISAVRDPVYASEKIKDREGRVTGCEVVMADRGVEDKRLLVTESEFDRVLQVADRRDNTLSAVLRESWDTGDLHVKPFPFRTMRRRRWESMGFRTLENGFL
jgi:hypothetical protein